MYSRRHNRHNIHFCSQVRSLAKKKVDENIYRRRHHAGNFYMTFPIKCYSYEPTLTNLRMKEGCANDVYSLLQIAHVVGPSASQMTCTLYTLMDVFSFNLTASDNFSNPFGNSVTSKACPQSECITISPLNSAEFSDPRSVM